MVRKAIDTADCAECDDDSAEFRITDKSTDITEDVIRFDVECSCGETAAVVIDGAGTRTSNSINFNLDAAQADQNA